MPVALAAQQRAPLPAREQRDRNQQAEMRLVDQQPEQHAGDGRTPFEQAQAAAEERGGPAAVLPAQRIDEHGRCGGREQQRIAAGQREAQRAQEANQLAASHTASPGKIGERRERRGQHQQDRRIAVVIGTDVEADDALLKRVIGGPVENVRRAAVPREPGARPEIDEVVADRAATRREALAGIAQDVEAKEGPGRDRPYEGDPRDPALVVHVRHLCLPQRAAG